MNRNLSLVGFKGAIRNTQKEFLKSAKSLGLNAKGLLLSNIRDFKIYFKGMDKRLLEFEIIKKLYGFNTTELSSRVSQSNRYIRYNLGRLFQYTLKRDRRRFFRLASLLLKRSRLLQIIALQNVFPHWYKSMNLKDVKELLWKVSVLLAKGQTKYTVRCIMIPKPDGSERPLSVPPKEWRMVLYLVNLLSWIWVSGELNENQHGHRPGKGLATCWTMLLSNVVESTSTILEFDFKKFHDTISYGMIERALKRMNFDPRWINMLMKLNSPDMLTGGSRTKRTAGVPQGVSTSALLGMLVLELLGVYDLETYVGYADDGVVGSNSMTGVELEKELANRLVSLESGVHLKQEKTSVVKESGNWLKGLKFLGMMFVEDQLYANTRNGNVSEMRLGKLDWRTAVERGLFSTLSGRVFCSKVKIGSKTLVKADGSLASMIKEPMNLYNCSSICNKALLEDRSKVKRGVNVNRVGLKVAQAGTPSKL